MLNYVTKKQTRKDKQMWLDNLKELKRTTGMTTKQIAEKTNLPERTVARIFSGETENPYVDTLLRIVAILGGSLDELFAESKIVVGNHNLAALQEELDALKAEMGIISAENAVLKDKVATLSAENDLLRLRLEHKEEIISLHNYYINRLNS